MKVVTDNGVVTGIQLTIDEAFLVQDCLQDLFDLPSLKSHNITDIDIAWPGKPSQELQLKLDAILGRLEIDDVRLKKVEAGS